MDSWFPSYQWAILHCYHYFFRCSNLIVLSLGQVGFCVLLTWLCHSLITALFPDMKHSRIILYLPWSSQEMSHFSKETNTHTIFISTTSFVYGKLWVDIHTSGSSPTPTSQGSHLQLPTLTMRDLVPIVLNMCVYLIFLFKHNWSPFFSAVSSAQSPCPPSSLLGLPHSRVALLCGLSSPSLGSGLHAEHPPHVLCLWPPPCCQPFMWALTLCWTPHKWLSFSAALGWHPVQLPPCVDPFSVPPGLWCSAPGPAAPFPLPLLVWKPPSACPT